MLKEKYHTLRRADDVDTDPATKDLNDKQKGMLKNFLLHLGYVTAEPSETDKKTLVEAYFEGMSY